MSDRGSEKINISELIGLLLVLCALGAFLFFLYSKQNESISKLENNIDQLSRDIDALRSEAIHRDELNQKVVALESQINAISDINLKKQLNEGLAKLRQQISALPATVATKDRISLQKDRIALEKDWINTRNAVVGGLLQAGGLFFFTITAYLTFRNLKVAEENLRVSEEKQVTERFNAQENLRVSEEKQVTERFSKAVDQLGSDKIEVRLGGIYALEQITKDSKEKDYGIMNILAGFVRERSTARWKKTENTPSNTQTTGNSPTLEQKILTLPPTDIQAALNFVLKQDKIKNLDLRSADFSWMILTHFIFKGKNLQRANFNNADLSYADFSRADLSYANFSNANLSDVTFQETILNFANFSGAILQRTRFAGKDSKTGEPIKVSELKYVKFSETDPQTGQLKTADFSNVDFGGVDLSGVSLPSTKFVGAILTETKFVGADLRGANFTEVNLSKADFSGANLSDADFSNSIVTETKFDGANLKNAKLRNVALNKTDFTKFPKGEKTHLTRVNLENTDLTGADLSGINLETVYNLTQDQLDKASTYTNTKLPNYLPNISPIELVSPQQKQPNQEEA
ncbi:pentapeptide repeat-containing protein [Pseudanabaena sp. PCC 6802]|uniref:pentapeptide repeat-containing protein n=1 Tax=Pseudanabaena sp. PCC 6802 TaxID=118173 RepID=UPI000347B819|nr:pentapeptide repeat-containing protein [Pseudanabaena sp. PCC 6802]